MKTFEVSSLRASSIVIGLLLRLVIDVDEAVGSSTPNEPVVGVLLVRRHQVTGCDVLISQELMVRVNYLDVCILDLLHLLWGYLHVSLISTDF